MNELVEEAIRASSSNLNYSNIQALRANIYLVAKELSGLVDENKLIVEKYSKPKFNKHKTGLKIIHQIAKENSFKINGGLEDKEDIDMGVTAVDAIVSSKVDTSFFEVGTKNPNSVLLEVLYGLRHIKYFSLHLWTYSKYGYCFRNWNEGERKVVSNSKA